MRRGAPTAPTTPGAYAAVRLQVAGLPKASRVALFVAMACAMGFASACRSADPKADLTVRVVRFNELRQKLEWNGIYAELLDPEVRKSLKLEDFLRPRQSTMEFLGSSIQQVDIQGQRATVKTRIEANVPVLKPSGPPLVLKRQIDEQQDWVQRDGSWYIRLEGK